jgi:hypothetical protein
MGIRIHPSTKSQVVQKWVEAIPRDTIAAECGLSGGAVSGIVADWRAMVGTNLADQLRELAIALRKRSMTPVECATALRVVNMMNRLGVNDESLEYFISEIYMRGIDIGLDPKLISTYLSELVNFWPAGRITREHLARTGYGNIGENTDKVRLEYRPFSEILSYITKLKEEKMQLESETYRLRAEARELNDKKLEAERQLNKKLHDNAVTAQELTWYSEVKSELQRSGLEVAEVKNFVSAVRWVKDNRVNLVQVIKQFPTYQLLFNEVVVLNDKIAHLERIVIETENVIQTNRLKLKEIEDVKSLGYGLKELKLLHQTLKEIYEAHDQTSISEPVTKRFLSDIENDYDPLVGFKAKLDSLKRECLSLNEERNRQIARIGSIPFIGNMISSLFRKGLTEIDILQIASLFHNYPEFIDIWSSFKSKQDSRSKPESKVVSQDSQDRKNNKHSNTIDNNHQEKQNNIELDSELTPEVPYPENEEDNTEGNVATLLESLQRKYNPSLQEAGTTITRVDGMNEPMKSKSISGHKKKRLRALLTKRKILKSRTLDVEPKTQLNSNVKYVAAEDSDDGISNAMSNTSDSAHGDTNYDFGNQSETKSD